MKFEAPTNEGMTAAFAASTATLTVDAAKECHPMMFHEALLRLYNGTVVSINHDNKPPELQWRYALILAFRAGWYLRELQDGTPVTPNGVDLSVLFGVNESELESIFQQIKQEGEQQI
jgi:hypothetical protein